MLQDFGAVADWVVVLGGEFGGRLELGHLVADLLLVRVVLLDSVEVSRVQLVDVALAVVHTPLMICRRDHGTVLLQL